MIFQSKRTKDEGKKKQINHQKDKKKIEDKRLFSQREKKE
jgi:hypothetical protein